MLLQHYWVQHLVQESLNLKIIPCAEIYRISIFWHTNYLRNVDKKIDVHQETTIKGSKHFFPPNKYYRVTFGEATRVSLIIVKYIWFFFFLHSFFLSLFQVQHWLEAMTRRPLQALGVNLTGAATARWWSWVMVCRNPSKIFLPIWRY